MSSDTNKKKSVSNGETQATPVMIFGTIADTTWRMFVPVIGLMLLGLWVDSLNDTKPLYTFVGLGAGVIVAALLVWLQIKQVMKGKK